VHVEDGLFNYRLGSNYPLPDDIFTEPERWLEITVDSDTISPRIQLITVPYAYHSLRSDTAAMVVDGSISSASVQDNSLTGSDILDEAGISYAYEFDTYSLSSTTSEIDHVAINCPSSGYVVVYATGMLVQRHTSGDGDQLARVYVAETSAYDDYNNMAANKVASDAASGEYVSTWAIHNVFQVESSGVYNYYLNADVYWEPGMHPADDDILRTHLTAIFYPTHYGARKTEETRPEFNEKSALGR
ncbi:MAG: hypothetical protein JSV44_04475, partial [Candidatus Zixiibacteriota bacterium]